MTAETRGAGAGLLSMPNPIENRTEPDPLAT